MFVRGKLWRIYPQVEVLLLLRLLLPFLPGLPVCLLAGLLALLQPTVSTTDRQQQQNASRVRNCCCFNAHTCMYVCMYLCMPACMRYSYSYKCNIAVCDYSSVPLTYFQLSSFFFHTLLCFYLTEAIHESNPLAAFKI